MSDTKTVSGNIVHIQDKGAPTALSVIVNITPKQSGSGTPSPSNIRPISGWESVSVMVSPTEDEADATTTTTSLGRTVYGGTLDVVSGVLTVTGVYLKLNTANLGGSDNWPTWVGCGVRDLLGGGLNNVISGALSSIASIVYANTANTNDLLFLSASEVGKTKAELIAMAIDVDFYIPLATPQTYTLTGQKVNLLKDCYAWADSGDISITYETYLINGLFHKIWINGVKMFAPNDFTLERSDVYAGEITTCTGKTIADRIGWKYADMSLNWDYLPQEYLETILNLSGVFTITFENEEGVQFTEQCIRKGSTMTGTRFTDVHGNMMWKGVQFDISFINVHN